MTDKNKPIQLFIRNFCYVMAMALSLSPTYAHSNDRDIGLLTINPQKCVSLRQGQTCYVDIELQWSTVVSGNYCLYASTTEAPLQCWTKSQQGLLKTEFSSNENTYFYLKSEQKTLAKVELKMSWVYKRKRSSNSWRVF